MARLWAGFFFGDFLYATLTFDVLVSQGNKYVTAAVILPFGNTSAKAYPHRKIELRITRESNLHASIFEWHV